MEEVTEDRSRGWRMVLEKIKGWFLADAGMVAEDKGAFRDRANFKRMEDSSRGGMMVVEDGG
jgi:hypothetical protein